MLKPDNGKRRVKLLTTCKQGAAGEVVTVGARKARELIAAGKAAAQDDSAGTYRTKVVSNKDGLHG